jgi:hypothetical protein
LGIFGRKSVREHDVFPYLLGSQYAAAPSALRAALAGQADCQAHPGRRGHLQVPVPLMLGFYWGEPVFWFGLVDFVDAMRI